MATDLLDDRLPPQDLDAEQGVLGCCLVERGADAKVARRLHSEDFYREAHRFVWQAMVRVRDADNAVDLVTVSAELRRQGQLESIGGGEYLTRLIEMVPTAQHVNRYADIVEQCAVCRQAILLGSQLQGQAYANPADPATLLRDATVELETLRGRMAGRERIEPLGKHIEAVVVPEVLAQAEEVDAPGVVTGWPRLDEEFLAGGLRPGRLTVLMAKRKVGKSTLMGHLAYMAALQGWPVGIYSAEMSQSEVALKVICQAAQLPVKQVELGKFYSDGAREAFTGMARTVGDLPLYVRDERGLDVYGVEQWFRRLQTTHSLKLAIVDYLQLLEPHLSRETMERNVSDATRKLLVMAQKLDCHVILLSQLNVEGFAKWSGQTNDDAHLNWRVTRCTEKGTADADGDHFKFHIEQRFGRSGQANRLYHFDVATGVITETHLGSYPAPEHREVQQDGRY